ncbi:MULTISPECIES: hypothetical protein [Haloferax]|uniref:Glycosyltransferase RgtA/B/C/D-like domain-containing protein n=1 Tax=Haloferax marinum TaxID=2666143 RepID=A0A6A8G831_9EURY|nr:MULTISPECIES: hypothetical protein [Haloferax]KAB1198212.1 hypothetical protein Hfx1150_12090 [Haloferax sp. CBA1150]MRW97299.1 hypothetical protein [Haloferax marinum]
MIYRLRNAIENKHFLASVLIAVGVFGAVVAFMSPNAYTVALPPAIVIAGFCLFWTSDADLPVLPIGPKPALIFWFIAGSLNILIFVGSDWTRTIFVHYATVLWLITTGIAVFSISIRAIPLIVGWATAHRIMIYYSSWDPLGNDTLFHLHHAGEIVRIGYVGSLSTSKYAYTPLFHVGTAISGIIGNISMESAGFLSIGILAVIIPILVAAHLGKLLWSPKIGAVAGFLVPLGDFTIAWSVRPTPTTLGYLFFVITFGVLLTSFRTQSNVFDKVSLGRVRISKWKVVLLIIMIGMYATHQISTFILVISLGCLMLSYRLFNQNYFIIMGRIFIISGVIMSAWWLVVRYSGPSSSLEFLVVVLVNLITRLIETSTGAVSEPTGEFVLSGARALTVYQSFGLSILLGLASLGGGIWLSSSKSQREGLAISVVGGSLAFFAFAGPLIGINFLIPRRWFVFFYFPASILAAVGLRGLLRVRVPTILSSRVSLGATMRTIMAILVISSMFVGMGWNYMGAMDNPPLDKAPGSDRHITTASEQHLYSFVVSYRSGETSIVADFRAHQLLVRHYRVNALHLRLKNNKILHSGRLLAVDRKYAHSKHAGYYVWSHNTWWRVYGPVSFPRGSKPYDNGDGSLLWAP